MENKYKDNLERILNKIYSELKNELANQNVGVLFSAGVDSSLIAVLARDFGFSPVLYNFGTEYSKDKPFAEKLAEDMKLPLVFKEITRQEIEGVIPFIKSELENIGIDPNWMQIALAVGVYFIGKKANEDGIEVMLCGQGSDELFGGYAKYNGLADEELNKRMKQDIKSVMASDIKRDGHMLNLSGIELFAPYTDKEFIDYALKIPVSAKIRGETKKYIIRKVAENRGLPEYVVERPKNAMQYSSGVQKVIDKISKEHKRNAQKN